MTTSRWRVVLIVEDETDGVLLKAIGNKLCPDILLDPLPTKGCGEMKRRLATLVRDARMEVGKQGCVAVLLDADNKDPNRDEPHRSIFEGCDRLKVPVLTCTQTIEAWLLTDPGCRRFLGLPETARGTTDSLQNPKRVVGDAYRTRTGRTYEKRLARRQVAAHMSGPDPQRNRSFASALAQLSRCPVPRDLRR